MVVGALRSPHLRLALVTSKTQRTLRNVRSVLLASARQVSRTRLVLTALAIAILVTVVVLVPLPTAIQMRDWARALGPWFPMAFLGAHIVVTVFPFPRTAFTLAAGLLFGPALGIGIAVIASTVSAVLALLLVRAAGWQLDRLVSNPKLNSLDRTLRHRGWPAVLSLRMIPAVPFSVLNYAAGSSAVRVVPYTLATLIGLIPGTAAVVILGDAMTGNVSPLLILVSLVTACLGVAGLTYEVRRHRRHPVTDLRAEQCRADPDSVAGPAAVEPAVVEPAVAEPQVGLER